MSFAQAGAITLLCVACGGGGGGGSTPPYDPPPQSPPSIITQPADRSTAIGTAVNFSVVASGAAPLTYQWKRNGADIAGATTATHTVALPQIADSGSKWSVLVSNGVGSVTSAEATLIISQSAAISLVAGSIGGDGNFNGTGALARFDRPEGVAIDAAGNLFVADATYSMIRKVSPAGVVTTFAGRAGVRDVTDGLALLARFHRPTDIAIDSAGNLYVVDKDVPSVRKITPSGLVSTLAGHATEMGAVDSNGGNARFGYLTSVAVDNAGNVYVADTGTNQFAAVGTIRKITPAGVVTTFAGRNDRSGADDGQGTLATFENPNGLAVDAAGTVYVADTINNTVRRISASGMVTTFAGKAGTISAGRISRPQGVALDAQGTVHVVDDRHDVHKISSDGTVTTLTISGLTGPSDGLSTLGTGPHGLTLDAAGNIYLADTSNHVIRKITPTGLSTTLAGLVRVQQGLDGIGDQASFLSPYGLALAADGSMYVADAGGAIRKIMSGGVVSTLAGTIGVVGANDGTGALAQFNHPEGVAVDASGTVYVLDTQSRTIRKVTAAGVTTTFVGTPGVTGSANGTGAAASFDSPLRMVADRAGNLYVSDRFSIRKITPGAVVTTLAGDNASSGTADGMGANARFYKPWGLAVDGAGNVYVADAWGCSIRKITAAGLVSTLAGGVVCGATEDGTGRDARFNLPTGVAVDGAGNVYVADSYNHVIRKVTPGGVVSTVAGTPGREGISLGALPGSLSYPDSVVVGADGVLYVTVSGALLKIVL